MRLLDDDACLREAAGRSHDDVAHFGIDRRQAEIARNGNPLRPPARSRRGKIGGTVGGQRDRIVRLLAHHGIEEQREVFHVKTLAATRPGDGRNPTTPQKLAGLRKEPPRSEPCATQAMPVASATAAPPEEPAADIRVFQGLSVGPKTSLKVLAPAPNSGVFDMA